MAFNLNLIDGHFFSAKVEMVDDKNVLAKEFLYRYQILKQNEPNSWKFFFIYTFYE